MKVTEQRAIELLNEQDVVALPTETVYGLAARYDSEKALKKVFAIKKRPSFDPLIVHISDKNQIGKLTKHVTETENYLMDCFWPGPLTFILPKHEHVSPIITAGLQSVAIRMPQNSFFLKVINHTSPLAAPSANMFGKTSPTSAHHVETEFKNTVAVLDGGDCTVGIESTVVQILETPSTIDVHLLRPGMISDLEISAALQKWSPKKILVHFGANASSPGHVPDHYQPTIPLVVVREQALKHPDFSTFLCASLHINTLPPVSTYLNYNLYEPTHVARIFYSDLHRLSEHNNSCIVLSVNDSFFSESWRALRDRIEKASKISITVLNGQLFMHNKLETF